MTKLDLSIIFNSINTNDRNFYQKLSDEEKKAFSPLVIGRWVSSSTDKIQFNRLNDIYNVLIFPLSKHPDLLYKVLVACTPPKRHQYSWIPKKKRTSKATLQLDVVSRYMNCSKREASEQLGVMVSEDILEMSMELGDTADYIKKLKVELK